MAKPLIEGFGAYCNAAITPTTLTESIDMSLLTDPLSLYIGYKTWKCALGSLGWILGIKFENTRTKQFLEYIKNNTEEVRATLIHRIEEETEMPISQISTTMLIDVCEKIAVDMAANAESTATDYHGDQPNAKDAYVYNDRRFNMMRTIPKLIRNLLCAIVYDAKPVIDKTIFQIEKAITWSGSWRRYIDDAGHWIGETLKYHEGENGVAGLKSKAENWLEKEYEKSSNNVEHGE